jgi:hypothetical protein
LAEGEIDDRHSLLNKKNALNYHIIVNIIMHLCIRCFLPGVCAACVSVDRSNSKIFFVLLAVRSRGSGIWNALPTNAELGELRVVASLHAASLSLLLLTALNSEIFCKYFGTFDSEAEGGGMGNALQSAHG